MSAPIVLDTISVTFDEAALRERLRLAPGSDEAREFGVLLERARAVGRPKALYTTAFVAARRGATVVLNAETFASPVLARNLRSVERVFPYVATCGVEYDALPLPEESMLCRFWLDEIKAEALEQAHAALRRRIEEQFRPGKLAGMNPGASGIAIWSITDQRPLFRLLGDVEGLIGVRLTESCLMIPNKSLSGLFFTSEFGVDNCAVCPRAGCRGRRAPYDPRMAALLGGCGKP